MTIQEVLDNQDLEGMIRAVQLDILHQTSQEVLGRSDSETQRLSYGDPQDASTYLTSSFWFSDQTVRCDVYLSEALTRGEQLQDVRPVAHIDMQGQPQTFETADSQIGEVLYAFYYKPNTGEWDADAFTARGYEGPLTGQESSASGEELLPCGEEETPPVPITPLMPTGTPTVSSEITVTPVQTALPTVTETLTPTRTRTLTPTPSETQPTRTPTRTSTPTPLMATFTPTPTRTRTPTRTETQAPTNTRTSTPPPTSTRTNTVEVTVTPPPTNSVEPSATLATQPVTPDVPTPSNTPAPPSPPATFVPTPTEMMATATPIFPGPFRQAPKEITHPKYVIGQKSMQEPIYQGPLVSFGTFNMVAPLLVLITELNIRSAEIKRFFRNLVARK